MTTLTPCKFYFGDDPTYDGFTDGTTWNGFDNVWVTEAVHKAIVAEYRRQHDANLTDCEAALEDWDAMEPDDDGLYSYAYGFATSIDD